MSIEQELIMTQPMNCAEAYYLIRRGGASIAEARMALQYSEANNAAELSCGQVKRVYYQRDCDKWVLVHDSLELLTEEESSLAGSVFTPVDVLRLVQHMTALAEKPDDGTPGYTDDQLSAMAELVCDAAGLQWHEYEDLVIGIAKGFEPITRLAAKLAAR